MTIFELIGKVKETGLAEILCEKVKDRTSLKETWTTFWEQHSDLEGEIKDWAKSYAGNVKPFGSDSEINDPIATAVVMYVGGLDEDYICSGNNLFLHEAITGKTPFEIGLKAALRICFIRELTSEEIFPDDDSGASPTEEN